ncbi:MAG: very short patch repair endonuclease [Actinobacteria bacterium]|nr:very short patch repair endonuclease [Actinomycetota bacterium]
MVYPKNTASLEKTRFGGLTRSEVMSRIRGKGNEKTELRLFRLMRAEGIRGWRRHAPIPGRPDFSFRKQKVAVFVDGCFWHGCPKCFQLPRQNRAFWKAKIEWNRKRDRSVNGRLRRLGWKVLRIRECRLKHAGQVVSRLRQAIE